MALFTPRTTEREMRSAWWDIKISLSSTLQGYSSHSREVSVFIYWLCKDEAHTIWRHTIIKLLLWFGPARHRLPWLSRID